MVLKSVSMLALAAGLALGALGSAEAQDRATTFTVKVENFWDAKVLNLPDGSAIEAHIAPGAFAVVNGRSVLFEAGKPAANGLESLAEDGDAQAFVAHLARRGDVRAAGAFEPNEPFTITARPGDRLVLATMFVQSNDLFYAPASALGIPLFDAAKRPVGGDVTAALALWDAGTEVNETPGVGADQAPRQAGPNTGTVEHGIVAPVADGYAYPPAARLMKVTITPR